VRETIAAAGAARMAEISAAIFLCNRARRSFSMLKNIAL